MHGMRPSCVNQRFQLGCANSRHPTLLPLLLLLLLLLLLPLGPILVCPLLLMLLLLTPVVVNQPGKPSHGDTKADLTFKRVFSNYL